MGLNLGDSFHTKCFVCDKEIEMRKVDFKWKPLNVDGTDHKDENTFSVSKVLSSLHYPEDKKIPSETISTLTLEQFNNYLSEKIKKETKKLKKEIRIEEQELFHYFLCNNRAFDTNHYLSCKHYTQSY